MAGRDPAFGVTAAASFRFACHTMPWGDAYVTGIADIARAGFHGVQLRANVMPQFGEKPQALKALLAQQTIEFACFSSNNIALAPEREAETMALHEKNARFVAAAGGQFLQVTDERPKDRTPTSEDRKRMGGLLTTLGRRTAALGVKVVYHNHMGNLGRAARGSRRGPRRERPCRRRVPARHGALHAGWRRRRGRHPDAQIPARGRARQGRPDGAARGGRQTGRAGVSVRGAGARPGRPAGRVRARSPKSAIVAG